MTVYAVLYTGSEITKSLAMPKESDIALNMEVGESYLLTSEQVSPGDYYISGGALTAKTELTGLTISSLTVEVDESVIITGLPNPTVVAHPGGVDTITDGSLDWASAEPGAYRIRLISPIHLEKVINVTVEI